MFNKFILEKIIDSAQNFPEGNAFYINETYYSYSQLIKRISAIAKSLKNIDEENIALIDNNDLDTYASIFAIWFTGKLYVPLNPDTPDDRNQKIINQVNTSTVLNSSETKKIKSSDYEVSIRDLDLMMENTKFDNQLAYIFFTSGSTGEPKGVMISKNNVTSFVEAFWEMGYNIDENDRCLQMFELTFDLSVMSFLIPLLKGACVYTIPKGKIKYSYIFELMDEKELTVALMVPSMLNYLRPYFEEISCPKMKYSLFCGEALHLKIAKEWSECLPNARIDNVYGPTENTIFCTNYTLNRTGENDSLNGILSIGKSMKNNLEIIVNDENKETEQNEIGELCLSGNQLTPGYFNNQTLNDSMFFSKIINRKLIRFYRSGDLCLSNENGNIEYIGRKDSQVKVQGYRIELSEVEFYVGKAIENEKTLVALAIENKNGNYEIVIVIESNPFNLDKIKEYLKTKIPSYMTPSRFHFLSSFPQNVNGKIDRKKIIQLI